MARGLFGRLEGELAAREKTPGLSMADVLSLPEPLGRLCGWMLRQEQVTVADVALFLGQDETQASRTISDLLDRGFVREVDTGGTAQYRVRLAPKRGRKLPANLWQAIDDKVGE